MPDDRSLRPIPRAGINPARLSVVTPPAVEVALATDDLVKQLLRLDDAAADATYITHIIAAARRHYERLTGLALVHRTLKATFDAAPPGRGLELPAAPLASIVSVDYLDAAGNSTVWPSANYLARAVGVAGAFGRVSLVPGASWPDLGDYEGALAVTYVAGFGASAAAVPEELRLAVLFLAAHWYEQRLPINVGPGGNPLPQHLEALIEANRVAFLA